MATTARKKKTGTQTYTFSLAKLPSRWRWQAWLDVLRLIKFIEQRQEINWQQVEKSAANQQRTKLKES